MSKRPVAFLVAFIIFTLVGLRAQEIPQLIHYLGNLASSNGNAVNDNLQMIFRIYDQETAGSLLWTEIHDGVVVEEGLFNVQIGTITEFSADLFQGGRYLEISVAGETLSPRQKIGSLPFALVAQSVPESGPQFIEPVEVSQGNGPLAFTIFDASPNLPEGTKRLF